MQTRITARQRSALFRDESASAYDDIGATAAEGVRNTVCSLESAELTKIWERVNNDEKRSNKE